MAELILKNTSATLEEIFAAGAADGAVTVTITGADGTVISTGAATHGVGGSYTYPLAPQAELNALMITWTGAWSAVTQTVTTQAEIVGDNIFSLADLRAFGDQALANTTTYPDTTLRAARGQITDDFEDICGVSFIPRFARDTLDGTGTEQILVYKNRVNRIISASVDGVALSAGDLTNTVVRPSGLLIRKTGAWNWGFGGRNVIVSYEHGYTQPPAGISNAAKLLARYQLVSSDVTDRMVSFSNDLGQVRLSVPGTNYPTGIPTVDATLGRYGALEGMLP